MENASFELVEDDPPRLVVTGEIDLDVAKPFRDALRTVIDEAHSPAYVDLERVTFFNSTGIGVLIEAKQHADTRGVEIVVNASPSVMRVLEVVGLLGHFTIAQSPDTDD